MKALDVLREQQDVGTLGVIQALGNKLVLTQAEAKKVATATAAYNQTIKALAQDYDLAFLDADAKLQQLADKGIRD